MTVIQRIQEAADASDGSYADLDRELRKRFKFRGPGPCAADPGALLHAWEDSEPTADTSCLRCSITVREYNEQWCALVSTRQKETA